MSIISRITTWAAGQILKAADLNGEFNNVVTVLNNIDAGSTALTTPQMNALTMLGNITFNPTTAGIVGTTTNDDPATGTYAEYVSSTCSNVAPATTGNFSDATSISLTAGDWAITVAGIAKIVTGFQDVTVGFSTTSGNSSTGLTTGLTSMQNTSPPATSNVCGVCIRGRLKLASTSTVYLKLSMDYTTGSQLFTGAIQAERRR